MYIHKYINYIYTNLCHANIPFKTVQDHPTESTPFLGVVPKHGWYKLRIDVPTPFIYLIKKGYIFPQLRPYWANSNEPLWIFLNAGKPHGKVGFPWAQWGQLMGFPKKIINSNSSLFLSGAHSQTWYICIAFLESWQVGCLGSCSPTPSLLEAKISSPHVWWLRFQAAFLK